MKKFWKKNKVKNYFIDDIYQIDELVFKYGGCPDDIDYKIERKYCYWEWSGEDKWEVVNTTKEDFEKNYDNEEYTYFSEINYSEFEDKFWFEEFKDFLEGNVLIHKKFDFIYAVTQYFFKLKLDGQVKYFFNNIIESLNHYQKRLERIVKYQEERGQKINSIQEYVIGTYVNSYKDSINSILEDFISIYPELKSYKEKNNGSVDIIHYKEQKDDSIELTPSKKIWQIIGYLIASGKIEFRKIPKIGTEIYYKGVKFDSGLSLAKELSKEFVNFQPQSLKSYINDTINEVVDINRKNVFGTLKKAEFIILQCERNNITPSNYALEKLSKLKEF